MPLFSLAVTYNGVEHCQILEWKNDILIQVYYMAFVTKRSSVTMLITQMIINVDAKIMNVI